MKRFSLTFRAADMPVPPDDLRNAVDDVLLRMHPKFTYRLGRCASPGPGLLVVDIESEADKKNLSEKLGAIEQALPVVLETVGWGWAEDEPPDGDSPHGLLSWKKDPLARTDPLPVPTVFLPTNQRIAYRFALFAVLTLAMLLSFPIRYVLGRILLMELIWAGFYVVWLYTLREIPFNLGELLERIDCMPDALTLTFRYPHRTVRLPWESIREMDRRHMSCALRADGEPVRFVLMGKGGFQNKDIILKTILRRASLHFVESNFLRAVYRRSDAP